MSSQNHYFKDLNFLPCSQISLSLLCRFDGNLNIKDYKVNLSHSFSVLEASPRLMVRFMDSYSKLENAVIFVKHMFK